MWYGAGRGRSGISSVVYKRKRGLTFWGYDLFQKATISSSASQSCWFWSCFTVFCNTYTVPVCLSCVYFWSPCPTTPSVTLIIMGKMLCCQTQTLLWYGNSLPLNNHPVFPSFTFDLLDWSWFISERWWSWKCNRWGRHRKNTHSERLLSGVLSQVEWLRFAVMKLAQKKGEKAIRSQQNYISNPKS